MPRRGILVNCYLLLAFRLSPLVLAWKIGMAFLRHAALIFLLAAIAPGAAQTGPAPHPNFSGVWKLMGTDPPEVYVVQQSESQVRIVMFVDNDAGKRILDVKAAFDGEPHQLTVDGDPCTFTARWDGDALYWETRRETAGGVRDNRRLMRLSADGKSIAAQRTMLDPPPEQSWAEIWEKQYPPEAGEHRTLFEFRDAVFANREEMRQADPALVLGIVATAFNDLGAAEHDLKPLARRSVNDATKDPARQLLETIYARNGQVRKALAYANDEERPLLEKLSHYPELSVAHRGYARVQASRARDGGLILPVSIAGREARFQIDTGSNMSLIKLSEASRLGLRLLPVSKRITDVTGVTFDAYLAIVPALAVGDTRLKNAPLWVVDDARLDVPGLLGIDVLLKFRTIRWSSSGVVEIGFPSRPLDGREANMYLEDAYPIVQASSNGQDGLTFYLDTGFTDTHFFVPFAARLLDVVAATGRQEIYRMSGEAGSSNLKDLVVPKIALHVGGMDVSLRDAVVLLEKAPAVNEWHHGRIGIDLLNQAERVTLDFQAMRLTLEPPAASTSTRR